MGSALPALVASGLWVYSHPEPELEVRRDAAMRRGREPCDAHVAPETGAWL
jgi:hypothetical protein